MHSRVEESPDSRGCLLFCNQGYVHVHVHTCTYEQCKTFTIKYVRLYTLLQLGVLDGLPISHGSQDLLEVALAVVVLVLVGGRLHVYIKEANHKP